MTRWLNLWAPLLPLALAAGLYAGAVLAAIAGGLRP